MGWEAGITVKVQPTEQLDKTKWLIHFCPCASVAEMSKYNPKGQRQHNRQNAKFLSSKVQI